MASTLVRRVNINVGNIHGMSAEGVNFTLYISYAISGLFYQQGLT